MDVWTKKRHTVWNYSYLQYRKRRLLKQRLLVYLHRCASRCARLWLWRHVYSLRGSSWWMWLLFEICILLLQWIIDTGIYVHGTGNNILRLNVHNAFHNVFLIMLFLDYNMYKEFVWWFDYDVCGWILTMSLTFLLCVFWNFKDFIFVANYEKISFPFHRYAYNSCSTIFMSSFCDLHDH